MTATSPSPPNPPPAVHTITIHVPHGTAMHRRCAAGWLMTAGAGVCPGSPLGMGVA
jgi:hypothetical protein